MKGIMLMSESHEGHHSVVHSNTSSEFLPLPSRALQARIA